MTVAADIALGSGVGKVQAGVQIGVMLLKVAEADSALRVYESLSTMLAAGGGAANVEANASGYARKTGITGTVVLDHSGHLQKITIPNQTFAGVAAGNSIVKLVPYWYASGSGLAATDTVNIPFGFDDWTMTTDGSDLVAVAPAGGMYSAGAA